MSKTYIDQLRYDAKGFYDRQPPEYEWLGPFRIFLGHNKKDLNEPDWRRLNRTWCVDNYANAEWWRKWSNRNFRRRNKQLLHQERYEELLLKPVSVDYHLW